MGAGPVGGNSAWSRGSKKTWSLLCTSSKSFSALILYVVYKFHGQEYMQLGDLECKHNYSFCAEYLEVQYQNLETLWRDIFY